MKLRKEIVEIMETKVKKGQGFSSRIGLLLTLIGAAIGAGNFWRFPRVVTLNGGGALEGPQDMACPELLRISSAKSVHGWGCS